MTVLLTCNGYTVIREVTADDGYDLPVLCLEEERRINDGYAVLARCDGKLVADAEGWYEAHSPSQYERQESSFGESE